MGGELLKYPSQSCDLFLLLSSNYQIFLYLFRVANTLSHMTISLKTRVTMQTKNLHVILLLLTLAQL